MSTTSSASTATADTGSTPATSAPSAPPPKKASTTTKTSSKSAPKKTVDLSSDDDPPQTAMAAAMSGVNAADLLSVASPAAKKTEVTPGSTEQQRVIHWMASPRPVVATQEDTPGTIDGYSLEIRLYGEGCLECSCLIPALEPEDSLPACHFSNDNLYCPAGHMRMRFVGEQLRITKKLKRAIEKRDVNRITQIIATLEGLDIRSREEVLKEVGLFNAQA